MGKEAIDTGGPTREFWRLIMQAIQEVKEKRVLIRTYLHSMNDCLYYATLILSCGS